MILRDDEVHLGGEETMLWGAGRRGGQGRKTASCFCFFCVCCTENIVERGVISRAASLPDFSHQLVISRTSSWSFLRGADYPTYWVSMLVGRIAECGIHFSVLGGGLSWLILQISKTVGHQLASPAHFST